MLTVIILKGLPASGKSTYAKEQVAAHPGQYKIISKDHLRAMLDNGKWSKGNEKFVLAARDALILAALDAGCSPIIDDTNLDPRHEQRIRELVGTRANVKIVSFTDVPLETCLERDRQRANYVGERVIRRMWRQYLAPHAPPPAPIAGLPAAILCDLDGTLALLNGRNPYDASRCEDDLLNTPVADIITTYRANTTIALIFLSGREDRFRAETERWLSKHGMTGDGLFMRASGDSRKDAVVKRELYDAHIAGKYNVLFVLDDRDQVVELWRSLGLTCLQVADGDF